jgi:hypothetical protein
VDLSFRWSISSRQITPLIVISKRYSSTSGRFTDCLQLTRITADSPYSSWVQPGEKDHHIGVEQSPGMCVCCCISVGSLVSFLASTCMGMEVALQPLRGTKGFYDNSPPPTLIEFTRPNKGSDLRAYLHLSSEFRPFRDRTDAALGCTNLNLADSVTTSGS